MWQEILVVLFFLIAGGYLVQVFRREFSAKGGCGTCGSACGAEEIQKSIQKMEESLNLQEIEK